jgi:BMFP domain-containing protein YqiC
MTTRERFERKLAALKARFEVLEEEMLDVIENLEDELHQAREENAGLQERIAELESEEAAEPVGPQPAISTGA